MRSTALTLISSLNSRMQLVVDRVAAVRQREPRSRQRLSHAQPRLCPQGTCQVDGPADGGDRALERLVAMTGHRLGRPGRQVNAVGELWHDRDDQVLVERLGQEGQHRGQRLDERDEGGVERGEGGVPIGRIGPRPHPVARSAQVPGRQVVDEDADRPGRGHRVEIGQGRLDVRGHARRSRQDPAVQDRPVARGGDRRVDVLAWCPAGEPGVAHEERVDVPQDQQLAARLVRRVPAEQDVLLGPGLDEHPAHDVDAHPLGGLVELDGVAPALVHRAPVLAEHEGVAEDRPERLRPLEHGRHRQHRVEPVAELAREALGDEVGREPRPPVVRVLAVVQRRERHDPRVQPRVADILDPLDRCAAARARDPDRVDVGPVRAVALELLPALDGTLPELVAPADHLDRPACRAVVDRQRQPPVALLADHPVVHVAEPVELALVAEIRDPADPIDRLHDLVAEACVDLLRRQRLAWLVVQRPHRDEPLVDQPEQQGRAASPAVRVAV